MEFFSDIPAPAWVALLGAISGIGARFVSESKINASFERARIKTIAESLTGEAAFRARMLAEIAVVRGLIKVCEAGRDTWQPAVLPSPDDTKSRTPTSDGTSRGE